MSVVTSIPDLLLLVMPGTNSLHSTAVTGRGEARCLIATLEVIYIACVRRGHALWRVSCGKMGRHGHRRRVLRWHEYGRMR